MKEILTKYFRGVFKMMKNSVRRVVEIAAGLVVGGLAGEGVSRTIKLVKKKVNTHKKKVGAH